MSGSAEKVTGRFDTKSFRFELWQNGTKISIALIFNEYTPKTVLIGNVSV